MYYKPTEEDHRLARDDYVNRVPFPSRCVHSVPLSKNCLSCEIDFELADDGFDLGVGSLGCFDPRD